MTRKEIGYKRGLIRPRGTYWPFTKEHLRHKFAPPLRQLLLVANNDDMLAYLRLKEFMLRLKLCKTRE